MFAARRVFPFLLTAAVILSNPALKSSFAEEAALGEGATVEINGDHVEFQMDQQKVLAEGNVSVTKGNVTLLCDKLEFYQKSKMAFAEGNVVLLRDTGRMEGDRLKFNFEDMTGDFVHARIFASPYFGRGEKIVRVGENHMQMHNGYLTTSDWDKPEYRIVAKKVDIYPGEKAVARHVRMYLGNVPIMYLPRFTQDLRNKRPVVTYTPGYDKQWGAFLLTQWHGYVNDNLKLTLHLDYRERKDLAEGLDVEYKTAKYGNGLVRTYYMHERTLGADHFFQEHLENTTERERFKGEWRHKWDIDEKTNAIWQYYKLSDTDFLKDYFENEHEKDIDPSTYFVLNRGLPKGSLTFQTNVRVNRFTDMVERIPQLTYTLANTELMETGFYLKNSSSYANMTKKLASPSEDRKETMRVHTDNELSYPFKVSFIELSPFVGGAQTYYSRAIDKDNYDVIRSIFRTGANMSTKFYRVFDAQTNKFHLDINRLRHIVTPSIAYLYQHDPTIGSFQLDSFDAIDAITRAHSIVFGVENKLQTKRNDKSVDLVRVINSVDFLLKEDPGKGGFNTINADIDITPYDWLSFYIDSKYDTIAEKIKNVDFDMYINEPGDKWWWRLGKRFSPQVDDQLTSEFGYRFNQKWNFRVYERFDLDTGTLREQEFAVQRDLHSWLMDVNFNSTRGQGDEILVVFTLKAFPELGLDVGTSYNQRKPGSQIADSTP